MNKRNQAQEARMNSQGNSIEQDEGSRLGRSEHRKLKLPAQERGTQQEENAGRRTRYNGKCCRQSRREGAGIEVPTYKVL